MPTFVLDTFAPAMCDSENILYGAEVFRIQGAVYEVNRRMGVGFLEAVYQECLSIEFAERQIPFMATPTLALEYRGQPLRAVYQPDFVCFDQIIVELKVASELGAAHRAQVKNYLKATNMRLGLLVNFASYPKTEVVRVAL